MHQSPLPAECIGGFITKPSKDLKAEWAKRLAESGFDDIEYADGSLRRHVQNTRAWRQSDMILDFFLQLDAYMNENKVPKMHKRILELYSAGTHLKDIGPAVGVSQSTAQRVITKYTKIIRSLN